MPFPITIDATKLNSPTMLIPGVMGMLSTQSIQVVQLEAGTYSLQTHATSDTSWQFVITGQGLIDYVPALDVSQGGFLSGNGSSTLGLFGFPITLDATALATNNYHISSITNWLPSNERHVLNLLPGSYQFIQGNGHVPEADFQIGLDGKVNYPASSDAFLSGRGTNNYGIFGFPITLDATALATNNYQISSITSWLPGKEIHVLNLLPGSYQFIQGNGPVPEADFQVSIDGKVDYAASSDAFLSGRGTSTYGIFGFPITLDGTALATNNYHISSITSWLPGKEIHVLNLLPGSYQFIQGNGHVPEADFQISLDGKVNYPASSDAFLTGRGSSTYGIIGFPIALDCTALATNNYHISSITSWLSSKDVHVLNLLPGSYQFIQGNGHVPEADFQVSAKGYVDYAPERDATAIPTGILFGRGTSTLRFVGFRLLIDASAYDGDLIVLLPFGFTINTAGPQPVSLLPSAALSLEIRTTEPKAAQFDLTSNGRLILDEAYPFVEIQWQEGQQMLRLTKMEIRQKRQCCLIDAAI